MKNKCKRKESDEERIWIFVAYKSDEWGDIPIFSKLFDDFNEMKEFSGEHSAKNKHSVSGYHSTYFDLTDKSYIQQQYRLGKEELAEEIRHEQIKLLDGFGHPKDCKWCNLHK